MSNEKKHADFQDNYRKSSNFNKQTKDVNLETDGKGNLKKTTKINELSDSEKNKIADSMDKMQRNIEMIPDGNSEEE
ncbi:hypothetical protein [Winogradskyella bathintestinalis]|uniref:Uncharacterized protein n=1 Tax=Winogradskyella bathintestinalis TaxID=3035208 RepID=A0ABT7ZUC4_9FLAO|nr:hypothetical protein [Winogradskyella bathintestinalis]MDN3492568.1 hypothetical protein [Winogradskyella bathintestinalis]